LSAAVIALGGATFVMAGRVVQLWRYVRDRRPRESESP
jgi:hypothetical protein